MSDGFNPIIAPASSGTSPAPDNAIDQVTPFLAGAANSLLFGLPEAGLKAIGGDKVKKIVEEYKGKNPGYGAGDVAGTVGSMFIPGGAIAKGIGLGAKALGAEKVAETLGKVAEVAKGPMGIQQGIATAAEQAIPRGVASAIGGDDAVDNAKNTATDIALGGVVGKAGQVLGKGLEALGKTSLGKNIKDEVGKMVQDTILSGADVTTNAIRKASMNSARRLGLDKTTATFRSADPLKDQITDLLVDNKILGRVEREKFLNEQGPMFQEVAKKYNADPVDFKNPDLLESIKNDPAVQDYATMASVGPEKVDSIIAELSKDLAGRTDWNRSKAYLTEKQKFGRLKGDEVGAAQAEIASAMEDAITNHTRMVAPEYDVIAKNYPAVKALKMSTGAEMADVGSPFKQGSNTAQKLALAGMGGAVGGATAPDEDRIKNAIFGAVGAPIGEAVLARAMPQIMGTIASKVPGALKKAGPGVVAGAERVPGLVANNIGQGAPIPAMQPMPNPTFDPSKPDTAIKPPTSDPLGEALENVWKMEDPTGNIAAVNPSIKQQFLDGLRARVTDKDGNIDYMRAAKILSRGNTEDEKNLQDSYQAYTNIKQALPNAVRLLNINNQKADTDKQLVIDSVADIMKKGGGDDKASKDLVRNILGNPLKTPQEKSELIYNLLQKYNPAGFGPGGILHRVGVLK